MEKNPPLFSTKIITNEPLISGIDDALASGMAIHDDTVYLKSKGLYKLQLNGLISTESATFSWTSIKNLPFEERSGQSMTSTSKGLAFFGGEDSERFVYNDLWLYNGTEWSYIATSLPPLTRHAACFDGNDSLIIHGGFLENKVTPSTDFFCLNLSTAKITKISLNFNEKLSFHSITKIRTGEFVLFGGLCDQKVSSKMYLVDFATKKCEQVHAPYEVASYAHHASEMFNTLFVIGGMDENNQPQKMWAFNFDHKVWFRFAADQFEGYFAFLSNQYSQNNSIHMVSRQFNQFLSYSVLKTSPTGDIQNNQDFLKFMTPLLKDSLSEFSMSNIQRKHPQSIVDLRKKVLSIAQSKGVSKEKLNKCKQMQEEGDQLSTLNFRITSLRANIGTKKKAAKADDEITSINPRDIAAKLRVFHDESIHKKKELSAQAKKSSQTVDRLSFAFVIQNASKGAETSVDELQTKCAKSKQLAQLIRSYRKENSELKIKYKEMERAKVGAKVATLTLIDQMCAAWQQTSIFQKKVFKTKENCIQITKDILEKRIEILNNNNGKTEKEICDLMAEAEAPATCKEIMGLIARKCQMKRELERINNSLLMQQSKTDTQKASDLVNLLEDFSSWMKAAKMILPKSDAQTIDIGNVPLEKFIAQKPQNILSTLCNWDSLDKELQELTSQLEK